ncbi:hypothetical protein JTB14_000849 [Gonioctena quinquepunctata]|nr:hypothetical protein JTB14_000849 [Gonioctena quinquepunctata]
MAFQRFCKRKSNLEGNQAPVQVGYKRNRQLEVSGRYKFESQNFYKVDEMGITTVQKPDRIIARKGVKQHFVKQVRSSIDNNESHLSSKGISFCKDNGVVEISPPPHYSHKTQPYDRSVYEPLEKYINRKIDSWMGNHAGKTMTIYDISSIARKASPLAATLTDIQAGFRVSGIFCPNRHIFGDDKFFPAAVTDRPNLENAENMIEPFNKPEQTMTNLDESLEAEAQETVNDTGTLLKQDETPKAEAKKILNYFDTYEQSILGS